jgi:hypothetical protein
LRYLKEIGHVKEYPMMDPNLSVSIVQLGCKTTENKIDCGIFAMRFMETFLGIEHNYLTGFGSETPRQKLLITTMRKRYAHRLLTFELNKLKPMILEKVKAYMKEPEQKRNEDKEKAALQMLTHLFVVARRRSTTDACLFYGR